MYVLRILTSHPLRLALTLAGIAACVILILFILGVYSGVATGSVEYVRQTEADIWVLQANTTNIIRGTSVLPDGYLEAIRRDERVASAHAVLLFLANIAVDGENATVLLTGFEPGGAGGPPRIVEGRSIASDGEIVLDHAFARMHQLAVGDSIHIRGDALRVAGLSEGTNAFVTQYAFVTLAYEQSIIELPGLASVFILTLRSGEDAASVMRDIDAQFPGRLSLYSHEEFLENNIRELEAGVLPLFAAIAVIGGAVLAIILSLILSVNILERRKDFAIMKLIGSPGGYLARIVVAQSLLLAVAAEAIALLLFLPLLALVRAAAPEVTAELTGTNVLMVTVAVLCIGVVSGLLAGRRVRRITPSEVFS